MQIVTKIDESGTHGDSDSMVMAGYTARLGQWHCFDKRWRKELRRAKLDYFHTTEHLNHPFVNRAVKIADNYLMFGFVVRLDKADYEKYRSGGGWGGKAQPDSMYGLCFRFCLSFVLQQILIEEENPILDFVLESGHPNEGAPADIVAQIKQKKIKRVSEYLGTATLGDKHEVYGLQAADGLAFGAWHAEQAAEGKTIPLVHVPGNATVEDARPKSSMNTPIFRCHVDERELREFKDGYLTHIDWRKWYGKHRKPDANAEELFEEFLKTRQSS